VPGGRKGGAPFKITVAKVRLAMAAMGKPKTKVADLCRELGVTRQTLYRHVSPAGNLREDGRKLLKTKRRKRTPVGLRRFLFCCHQQRAASGPAVGGLGRCPVSGSLLLSSAFPRKSVALAAGALEFVVLSGRLVETVARLTQRRPLQAWLSLVVHRQRLSWVRAARNRRDFHLAKLAHGGADLFTDLAEGVQVLEVDRYLLYLSRLALCGKGGASEQLAQRLFLFRARARIDVVSHEGVLDRLADDLESELAGEPKLHAVQLHLPVLAVVRLAQREEFA
jgi:hypothetical protein